MIRIPVVDAHYIPREDQWSIRQSTHVVWPPSSCICTPIQLMHVLKLIWLEGSVMRVQIGICPLATHMRN